MSDTPKSHLRETLDARRRRLKSRLKRLHRQLREPAHRVKYEVRYRLQLLTRGWADSEIWSLDVSLSRRAGQMLEAYARSDGYIAKNGEPSGAEGEELKRHVEALKAYGNGALWDDYSPAGQQKVVEEAQAAFRWIADELPGLWT